MTRIATLLIFPVILSAQPLNWTAQQDHQNMMDQLGIKALRPGPSGRPEAPNQANYDESKANPYPDLPDPLTLKNGKKVTTALMWWEQRRPEIVEDFEREVYGRVPKNAPKITWKVINGWVSMDGIQAIATKELVGHADNSAYPGISVDIQMKLVTPAGRGPVPVMMMFSGRGANPMAVEQLSKYGWGYATINPVSVQADNGAGLTQGIIGLANHGRPRKPDDWGALRAWAWGASRGLDYLQTDKDVDARHVGIEGVSRYGKAALVAMAFDPRFAVVLVGSSGEGGAKLHRRNFGEAVENLTGAGEYHWMAGNFLKYGASDAAFGSKTAADLPVDAHELIALCAPRLTFISYGSPEHGDAPWLDQKGSFMATVAAGPVFRLLGAKDLGTTVMPPINTGLLDGRLAWRQHDGGHTDGPNWQYFVPWAGKFFGRGALADEPVARTDQNSWIAHARLLEKAKEPGIKVYFEGDSIARRWDGDDYPQFAANFKKNFAKWHAADFGWGADTTQNILWRLEHGEMDGVNPKIVVLLAGTNNIGRAAPHAGEAEDVTRGVEAIVRVIEEKAPGAAIVVTGIFPRNDNRAAIPVIEEINRNLAKFADGQRVRFLNINDRLADGDGKLHDGMTVDQLHPTLEGYQIWADALKPIFKEVLSR